MVGGGGENKPWKPDYQLPFNRIDMRDSNANMKVCLDRAWRNLFDNTSVRHLMSPCSDHVPLHVACDLLEDRPTKPRLRHTKLCGNRRLHYRRS